MKVWILVAVCRYSQAVFLDEMLDCTTEVVITSLRKLQAFYTMTSVITSDRGTNFMGAKRILDDVMRRGNFHL